MLRHLTIVMGVLAFLGLSAPDASALVYNVMAFGAAGDGTTDDWQEIQNAINAAVAAGGGEVYLPAGKYKMNQTLTVSGASVSLRGEGQRTSILLWRGLANSSNGLNFISSGASVHHTMTVRGLSLLRDDGIGGVALAGVWPHLAPGGTITHNTGGGVTAVIEDIHIGTGHWPNVSEYWDYGIVLLNAAAAKISTFNVQGPGNGITGIHLGGAAHASGTPGRSVGAAITDGTITGFTNGVFVYDSTEAVNVQQVVIRNATIGIQMVNAGRGTSVANNQIWTKVYGVRNYNSLGDIAIIGNRIYRETDTSFVGVEINTESVQSTRNRVVGNYIFSPPGTSAGHTGILVANNIQDTIISGNTTHSMTSGIVLANASVTRTLVHGNQNRNAGTAISWAASTNPALANNW